MGMPECQHCGSHVTKRFVRVRLPEDMDQPMRCFECESHNRIRNGAAAGRCDAGDDPQQPIEGAGTTQPDILLTGARGKR